MGRSTFTLSEVALRSKLEAVQAKVRDLQRRLLRRKGARSKGANAATLYDKRAVCPSALGNAPSNVSHRLTQPASRQLGGARRLSGEDPNQGR